MKGSGCRLLLLAVCAIGGAAAPLTALKAPTMGRSAAHRSAAGSAASEEVEDDNSHVSLTTGHRKDPLAVSGGAAEVAVASDTPLLVGGFLFCISSALVALCPAPHLISVMGSEPAMRLLASLSSSAAAIEIMMAPIVGSLVDSSGRKPILLFTTVALLVVHTVTAFATSTLTIATSKL